MLPPETIPRKYLQVYQVNQYVTQLRQQTQRGSRAAPRHRRFIAVIAAALMTHAAHAQSSDEDLREVVRKQAALIEVLDARVRALEGENGRGVANVPSPAPAPAPPPPNTPIVKWKGGPEISSSDGNIVAKMRGRVMTDAWSTASEVDGVDYPSGTEIRAARLGIEGRLSSAFFYKLEADFANEQTSLKDAWLQYRKGRTAVTVGNFKPLFSLENLTGLPRATFLERALPNVFAIVESVGAQVETYGDGWYAGASAFGETPGTALEGDEGFGMAARFAFVPILDENKWLHLGVSGYQKHLGRDAGRDFRIRQRPETRVFATRLVDTGRANADSTSALGAEVATAMGPFSFQAEYLRNQVDYVTTGRANFDGAYAFASWFVTGEMRPYTRTNSTIGRIKPKHPVGDGGWGALELALRYSTLDLSDAGIQGGEEDNVTIGLNWYLSEYSRLMLNWVHYEIDGTNAMIPFGSSMHKGESVGLRAQVDW
jgi:phosphate-selective porin OprO/OprP